MSGKTAQLYGITARSNSLAELLSSKVKAELFRLLFGINSEPLHLRELERRSGLAVGTVQQELARLTRLGLLEKRVDGNRRCYSAREDHPLYPEIRGLVLKTSGLADLVRDALKKEKAIRVAFVFGSFANAREQAHSDIDLLVIGTVTLRQLTKLLSGVAEKIGREINPKVFTLEEFRRRKRAGDHFLSNVLAESRIYIVGDDHELGAVG
jgi:predicted nucleotidyltransferase/DNA-binding HxlR family transcriptional regulator